MFETWHSIDRESFHFNCKWFNSFILFDTHAFYLLHVRLTLAKIRSPSWRKSENSNLAAKLCVNHFWKLSITFDRDQMIMNINARYIMGKINQNLFRHVISKNAAKLLTQSSKLMRLIYIDDFDSTGIANSLSLHCSSKNFTFRCLRLCLFCISKWQNDLNWNAK